MESHPLLQIPCSLQTEDASSKLTPLQTYVDTGAQVSVLSYQAAQRCGLLHLLDRRYSGHALGVGSCRVVGRLPAGCCLLFLPNNHILCGPAITVLEHTNPGVDLLLGLDFLRDHQAILNLRENEMVLRMAKRRISKTTSSSHGNDDKDVSIPFIRPRANVVMDEDEDVPSDGGEFEPYLGAQAYVRDDESDVAYSDYEDDDDDDEGIDDGEDGKPIDMSGV
jgi:hypothetical protein